MLPVPTVKNRKAAVNAVLGFLPSEEVNDVGEINLDQILHRFANLQGGKYTPGSMNTYASRVRTSIDDFLRYQQNPLGFKMNTRTTPQKTREPSRAPTQSPADQTPDSSRRAPLSTAVESTILPIPIRSGLVVYIQGLPHDLSRAEANKIANVVKAMAADETE